MNLFSHTGMSFVEIFQRALQILTLYSPPLFADVNLQFNPLPLSLFPSVPLSILWKLYIFISLLWVKQAIMYLLYSLLTLGKNMPNPLRTKSIYFAERSRTVSRFSTVRLISLHLKVVDLTQGIVLNYLTFRLSLILKAFNFLTYIYVCTVTMVKVQRKKPNRIRQKRRVSQTRLRSASNLTQYLSSCVDWKFK